MRMRALAILALLLGACAPYQTRNDFQSARRDVSRGGPQASKIANDILANLNDIPPAMVGEALDTLIAIPDPEGERAVLEASTRPQFQAPEYREKILRRLLGSDSQQARDFVLKEIKAKPDLMNDPTILSWVVAKDPPGASELVLAHVQKNPASLNEQTINYFGTKRYTPSIPVLLSSIDSGKNADLCLKTLAQMGDPKADAAILSIAQKESPVQMRAIQALPEMKDPDRRKEAESVLEGMWKNNPPGEMKTTALTGLAKMRGQDPLELEREAAFPMANVQGDLAVNSLEDRAAKRDMISPEPVKPAVTPVQPVVTQPTVVPTRPVQPSQPQVVQPAQPSKPVVTAPRNEPAHTQPAKPDAKKDQVAVRTDDKTKPADKKDEKRDDKKIAATDNKPRKPDPKDEPPPLDQRASDAYRERISNLFADTFGDGGSQVLRRIQDSLFTYSESNSTAAEFMVRSYRKRYGGSDTAIRKMMARGLKQPDCMAAILNNIKTEYPTKEMQIYAISKLFALQRWQSQVVLELSQETQL